MPADDPRSDEHGPPDGVIRHPFAANGADEGGYAERGPDLPERYGIDTVAAIPRAPDSLLVYWELSGAVGTAVREDHARAWALRITETATGWQRDVSVQPAKGDYYFHELPAGGLYRVALGWRERGEFHAVAASHETRLPGAPEGESGPVVFVDVKTGERVAGPEGADVSIDARRAVPGLEHDPDRTAASSYPALADDDGNGD